MPPRQKARGTPNFNFTVDGLPRTACAGALLLWLGLAAGRPAGAQSLVGSADCAAEQAVMRRMGAPESVIRGALHPPGVDTGATAAALSAMRDTLREALSIAQAGGMKQDAATFGLNLCAYSAAIARQPGGAVASASANQPGNASPPARHTKAAEPDRNDSACVTVRDNNLFNQCKYAVDVGFCVENPRQTKNFFDGSDAFDCSKGGGLSTLGPGSKEPNILHGKVHWWACTTKARGTSRWRYVPGSGWKGNCFPSQG